MNYKMVYFLKPSYGFRGYSFDAMSGNNLIALIAAPVVVMLAFMLVVWFKRPTWMGLCTAATVVGDKNKINWGKTIGVMLGLGVVAAAITYGVLYAMNKEAAAPAASAPLASQMAM